MVWPAALVGFGPADVYAHTAIVEFQIANVEGGRYRVWLDRLPGEGGAGMAGGFKNHRRSALHLRLDIALCRVHQHTGGNEALMVYASRISQ
jgi:hypothetical protein